MKVIGFEVLAAFEVVSWAVNATDGPASPMVAEPGVKVTVPSSSRIVT